MLSFQGFNSQDRKWNWGWLELGRPSDLHLTLQKGTSSQQAEVVVQVPYLEASGGAAFPLQEEAEDGPLGECWMMCGFRSGVRKLCSDLSRSKSICCLFVQSSLICYQLSLRDSISRCLQVGT